MKALSLHQPWASMIASGEKTIETRFWYTSYRGDFLVCSTKQRAYDNYPLGKALCIVQLVHCRLMKPCDEALARCPYEKGRYAWILKDIRPIEPFPVKGQQGWFQVALSQEAQAGQKGLFR